MSERRRTLNTRDVAPLMSAVRKSLPRPTPAATKEAWRDLAAGRRPGRRRARGLLPLAAVALLALAGVALLVLM